jgi:CubicO group peptidase (beta-lactamase class C family)
MSKCLLFLILIALLSVGAAPNPAIASAPTGWDAVTATIEKSALDDLIVIVGDKDKILYTHAKGTMTNEGSIDTVLPIASASKWLTGATIMRLIERKVLALDDHPQKYISWWTTNPKDKRSEVTLAQLISMTSGFSGEPWCVYKAEADFEACAREMYQSHHRYKPGSTFHYTASHMHIAALMASNATGLPWPQLFRENVAIPLGMTSSEFNSPSVGNSWPAGGAVSTGMDYAKFLQGMLAGKVFAESRDIFYADRTPSPVKIAFSPYRNYFHYSFGFWRECYDLAWSKKCDQQVIASSGGAWGWFPWIDFERGYYGVIARYSTDPKERGSILLSVEMRVHIEKALASQK